MRNKTAPVERLAADEAPAHCTKDAAVAAWKAGDWLALHQSLGLRPWECSPLDVTTTTPAAPVPGATVWAASLSKAAELRGN